jgi:antitoxin component HigA of HigAB toxin-antitoxin module
MPKTQGTEKRPLPKRFDDLVALMAPRAISDDVAYENTVEMIDRLMASGRLAKGQADYLETLVQLVEAYDAREHAIDVEGVGGVETLRHLMGESGMSGSDLARLLGLHASMGSKILNGDRSLTIDHVRLLSAHFAVRPDVFVA